MRMMGICDQMAYEMNQYDPQILSPLVGLHAITSLSATWLNILVLVTICRTPSLQTPSRILLCSLSLTDLCIGLIAQPVAITFYLSAFNNWRDVFCISWVIMTRLGYSMGMTALVILTAMSFDRYLAITTKARYKTLVTKKRTTTLVIFLWIFASLATITGLHFLPRKEKFCVLFAVTFIFLLVIAFSYISSFCHLKKMSTRVSHTTRLPTNSYHNILKYKHSLSTVIMLLALNLLVYVPLLFLSILTASTTRNNSVTVFQYVGFFLSFSSTANPIFYLWRMRDLRDATKSMLGNCFSATMHL